MSTPSAPQPPVLARVFRLTCPHCGLQAVSVPRKWALTCLGWDKPVPCQACAQMVRVDGWPVVAWTAPFLLFMLGAAVLLGLRVIPAGWVYVPAMLVALLGLAGVLFAIPLSKKGHTDARLVERARAAALNAHGARR